MWMSMERHRRMVALGGAVLLVASLCLNVRHYGERHGDVVCERVTFVDTIPYYKPVPRDSTVIRYVSVRLPAGKKTECREDSADDRGMAEAANLPGKENGAGDSSDVEVPITRTVYEDSTYRAVVSGYRASLEEITVFPRRELWTVRQPVVAKRKRWSVGVQAGYGMTPAGFQPYLGVGVSCNLYTF